MLFLLHLLIIDLKTLVAKPYLPAGKAGWLNPKHMAHLHASIKDIRKTKKRTSRNIAVTNHIDNLRRKARKLLESKQAVSFELAKEIISALDKAYQRGIMKKNTVSRYKSRLMKKTNK